MKNDHRFGPLDYSHRTSDPIYRIGGGETPTGYTCDGCGSTGVRLFREYNMFLEGQTLRCVLCAVKAAGRPYPAARGGSSAVHWVGDLPAAVPTEDGSSMWGFTSVPEEGVKWWESLPLIAPTKSADVDRNGSARARIDAVLKLPDQ